jgi:5,10-methenyltetrahydromethanopterin hydrogenase
MKRYKSLFEQNSDDYDLKTKYKEFNDLYFNGELSPTTKLEWADRMGDATMAMTHPTLPFTIKMGNKKDLDEIVLDSTLIHEMIHVLQFQMGRQGFHDDWFNAEKERIEKLNPKLDI